MTIRKTLLLAFLLVGVTPAVLLALLAFDRARHAVQAEIEHGLVAQAEAVASDIDKQMYERLQNAATWSRLEVMQDLQVGDVDKRLSDFLQRLQRGYGGLYRELSALDRSGRVVASSEAAQIGQAAASAPRWQAMTLGGQAITLAAPDDDPRGTRLTIRVPVASAFAEGELGTLQLGFDWTQIDRVLDQAAGKGRTRLVALVDGQGRLVAGSRALLTVLPRFSEQLADWARRHAGSAGSELGRAPLPPVPMFVGVGRARGYAGFDGFGWQVLVLEPRSEALAPIDAMALIFLVLLGGVALLTLLGAGWVSQAIARPIVALTAFSRGYRHAGAARPEPPPVPARHSQEVGELREAFVQMVRDIDQQQAQLARAAALAAVGEMSAVIAHEIRTPLGIVHSSAQILQREQNLSPQSRELAGFIESETMRLNGLVSTMLDSARPRPPRFAPTDLHELLQHVVALLSMQAARQQVQVTLQLQAADPQLQCDAEQMTQVLLNLMLNGLQILSQGGRIVVTSRDAGPALEVDIADDGPGIAPEARHRIFEAFFFQREGGVGLGLAVVQKIVAAHGGEVQAGESELGGALFRIRLPRQKSDST